MTLLGTCLFWTVLLAFPAFADDGLFDAHGIFYAHIAVTGFGMLFAAHMANQAFGRRAVQLADTPTFPRYMTSRGQYLLGSSAFIVLATFVFLLILYLHKEVVQVASVFGDQISSPIISAVEKNDASYLTIIAAMGVIYLFLLQKELEWNVLLMTRNLIHSWISVPQLGRKIVDEISFALVVPEKVIDEIINSSTAVSKADFRKDRRAVDRLWAETCYMRWWIAQRQNSGDDTTFFSEPSFGLEQLVTEYDKISWVVKLLKQNKPLPPQTTAETIAKELRSIRQKFSRLVACYLVYKNGSRQRLAADARNFGVPFKDEHMDNPLRYSIIYVITVILAVYVGVYGSAIFFDVFNGKGLLNATSGQDEELTFRWIMYSLSNYGLAIITVLAARFVIWKVTETRTPSYMLTYCWTFLLAGEWFRSVLRWWRSLLAFPASSRCLIWTLIGSCCGGGSVPALSPCASRISWTGNYHPICRTLTHRSCCSAS